MNPTTTVKKAIIAENPERLNPIIKTIGNKNPMVVMNPQLSFEAIMKYNIRAIIVARNTLPAISETKIHLKSNILQLAMSIFGPQPFGDRNRKYHNYWPHD